MSHLIKAAETLSLAQHALGIHYQKTQCFDLAARCFEVAYKNGFEESFDALEELANQNHSYACYLLGNLSKQQNQWTNAYYWMSKAKEFGCSEASSDLTANQNTYARHLIQAGIECEAEDQELALHFYRNATHCNSAFAMIQVARIFLERGELADAFAYLFMPKKISLNAEELAALRNLQFQAGNYLYQIGDLEKADQLLFEAQKKVGKAALLRGLIHEKHQIDVDIQQQIVIASYRQAAKLKTPLASAFLGQFHLNLLVKNSNHPFSVGDDNYLRAIYHFEKAANSSDIWSLLSLAGLKEVAEPIEAKQIYSSLLGRSSERRTKDDLDGISIVEMRARARKKVFVHAS